MFRAEVAGHFRVNCCCECNSPLSGRANSGSMPVPVNTVCPLVDSYSSRPSSNTTLDSRHKLRHSTCSSPNHSTAMRFIYCLLDSIAPQKRFYVNSSSLLLSFLFVLLYCSLLTSAAPFNPSPKKPNQDFLFPRRIPGLSSVSAVQVVNPRDRSKRSTEKIMEIPTSQRKLLLAMNNCSSRRCQRAVHTYLEVRPDGIIQGTKLVKKMFIVANNTNPKDKSTIIAGNEDRDTVKMSLMILVDEQLLNIKSGEDIVNTQLREKEKNKILLRRSDSDTFVCMDENGVVLSEHMVDYTVTYNCVWNMRIAPYGLIFEHAYYPSAEGSRNKPWYLAISRIHPSLLENGSATEDLIEPPTWAIVAPQNQGRKSPKYARQKQRLTIGTDPRVGLVPQTNSISQLIRRKESQMCRELSIDLENIVLEELSTLFEYLNQVEFSLISLSTRLSMKGWSEKKINAFDQKLRKWVNLLYLSQIKRLKRVTIMKPRDSNFYRKMSKIWKRPQRKALKGEIFLNLLSLVRMTPRQREKHMRRLKVYALLRRKLKFRIPPMKQIRKAVFYFHRYLGDKYTLFSVKTVNDDMRRRIGDMVALKFEELAVWGIKEPFALPEKTSSVYKTFRKMSPSSECYRQFKKVLNRLQRRAPISRTFRGF